MKGFFVAVLEDGTYDVMVVDAVERADGTISLELAVSSGARRGEVVDVVASNLRAGWIEVLGAPGTLVVLDGQPHFEID